MFLLKWQLFRHQNTEGFKKFNLGFSMLVQIPYEMYEVFITRDFHFSFRLSQIMDKDGDREKSRLIKESLTTLKEKS